jgi:hypothetical protein
MPERTLNLGDYVTSTIVFEKPDGDIDSARISGWIIGIDTYDGRCWLENYNEVHFDKLLSPAITVEIDYLDRKRITDKSVWITTLKSLCALKGVVSFDSKIIIL